MPQPPDTPLTPFLTRDGQLAFVDGEGAIAWRAHYDGQQVALLDTAGTPLWRSGVHEIHVDGRCTLEDPGLFSHRRDGTTGRHAAVVVLVTGAAEVEPTTGAAP